MGEETKKLLELALALPAEERRDLIDALVASEYDRPRLNFQGR